MLLVRFGAGSGEPSPAPRVPSVEARPVAARQVVEDHLRQACTVCQLKRIAADEDTNIETLIREVLIREMFQAVAFPRSLADPNIVAFGTSRHC